MKKKGILILLLSIFLFSNFINAEENVDVNENIQRDEFNISTESIIKYKWYIEEEVDGIYHPKGEKLEGYYEDKNRISYGGYTDWSYDYCSYSRDNYVVESDADRVYKKIIDTQYIKLDNFKYDNNIRVFNNTKEIEFEIIEQSDKMVVLNLKRLYEVGNLWLYVDTDQSYNIYFYFDKRESMMSLSKYIEKNKILIPDESWISEKSTYGNEYTRINHSDTIFKYCTGLRASCRAKQIKTYRYKLSRKYYDDEYHEYIDGYIPDINDYIIEYTDEIPTNTIVVTNTIKELIPVNKYVYLNSENLYNKIESEISDMVEKDEKKLQEKVKIETKYIENEVIKKVYRIPKGMYLIILILILIIIFETVKLFMKKVD